MLTMVLCLIKEMTWVEFTFSRLWVFPLQSELLVSIVPKVSLLFGIISFYPLYLIEF